AAAIGVGCFEDIGNTNASIGHGHRRAERGMIDDAARLQAAEEILDLIDRNRIAHADVDAAALLEAATAIDADQIARRVKQRAARVAGVDRGVGLEAVGIFQQRPRARLVAVYAGNDAV